MRKMEQVPTPFFSLNTQQLQAAHYVCLHEGKDESTHKYKQLVGSLATPNSKADSVKSLIFVLPRRKLTLRVPSARATLDKHQTYSRLCPSNNDFLSTQKKAKLVLGPEGPCHLHALVPSLPQPLLHPNCTDSPW